MSESDKAFSTAGHPMILTLCAIDRLLRLATPCLALHEGFILNNWYEYYGLSKSSHADPSETFSDQELELLSRALRGPLRQKPLTLEQQGSPFNSSYYAAWGDRTDDGGLYMTRNMDFTADSGLYKYAMVSVYVPDEGVPVASVSWLGASLGVLAGMSEEGLAVSAVGASSPYERIGTEPAIIRAREALGKATNLEEASVFLTNEVGDGIVRAPTIGYNTLVAWGDPRHDGAGAQAVLGPGCRPARIPGARPPPALPHRVAQAQEPCRITKQSFQALFSR